MKRTISVLIAAALLAFLFAACGQTPALDEPETPPSGADAKKLAEALFPGQTFMEYSEELSKSDVEERIRSFEAALTEEALSEDFGTKPENIELGRAHRTAMLNEYTQMLDTAPEAVEPQECLWTFFPFSHYLDTVGTEFNDQDVNDTIRATTETDGIPYQLWFTNWDLHPDANVPGSQRSVSIYVDTLNDEEAHHGLLFQLCGNDDPTPKQTSQIRETANGILAKLAELTGVDWEIRTVESAKEPLSDGRWICFFDITALPVDADTEITYIPNYASAGNGESAGAVYRGFMPLHMEFTNDGVLLSFELSAPLDTVPPDELDS